MPITAKTSGVEFEKVPVGNHIARCYSMVEIGTEEKEFQGEKKKAYVVRITWELPNEKKVFAPEKGEQPFSISKDYTLSMHEKANLRHDLQSWRGKAFNEEEAKSFDITKLIGVPCMLNVIHNVSKANGNTYANIAGVTAIPKGLTVPAQINPSFVFSYDEWSDSKFASLPEWLRKRIEVTPEFQKHLNKSEVNQDPPNDMFEPDNSNDDLPF
jgi:hypothetical protein